MATDEEIAVLRRLIAQAEPQRGTPEHGVTHIGGLTGMATQGALMSFGDEYLGHLSAMLGVQPDGQGGARWFDYSQPYRERYATARDQIRAELDEYREQHGGLATAAQIGGAISTAIPMATAAGIGTASTALGRAGQMIAGGIIGGAVEGFGAGEGGAASRARSAGQGAVFGAVAAPLLGYPMAALGRAAERVGGRALRNIVNRRRLFNPETGTLTPSGVRAVRNLGMDEQQMSIEMRRALGETLEGISEVRTPTPQAVERLALGRRFETPLTRGQATGDVAQSAFEESARAGTRGQSAYNAITEFDSMQSEAVDRARQSIVPRTAASDRIDAAEGVISGVQRMADNARNAGRQAYDVLEGSGAALSNSSIDGLRGRIQNATRIAGVQVDAATPNAQAALRTIDDLLQAGNGGSVPFMNVERTRQNLLRFQRAAQRGDNGADQIAISEVVGQFDNWLDDAISTALEQGDETVLAQAQEARNLWRQYRTTFLGRDGPANFIRRIVEEELTPNQVSAWIMGSNNNMGRGATSSFVRRLGEVLGPDSDEFNAIRVAAWDQITSAPEGSRQPGPARIAQQVTEFVSRDGRTLARELYTPEQLTSMREFARLMRTLEAPPRSTNPSGTGYEIRRMVGEIRSALLGGAASAAGGPVVGIAAQEGVERSSSFISGVRARAATQGIQVRPPSVSAAISSGVAAASSAQEGGASLPLIPSQRGPQ